MLTDTKLRALKSERKSYRVADANGLCIEIRPSGAKVWRYRYRCAGKASMVTLADYPTMTLKEARAERDRLRAIVKSGGDPALEARLEKAKQNTESAQTFGSIAFELLEKRAKEGLSEGSIRRERRWIQKDLAGIREIPIERVSAPILLAELRKLEKRGVVETAHRARALAGRVFRYAIATGRTEANPAENLAGALEQPRVKHLAAITEPELIGRLLRDIDGYKGSPITRAALQLAPLVFVRPGELRKARKEDIDLEAREWRFLASKTKAPHIVPLSRQAVAIIEETIPVSWNSEYLFPGVRSARRPMSENAITAALRYMGYDGGTMTSHGFRAMARTILDEVLGFRPDFIEQQLAHAVRDPLGRAYNRTKHLSERRKMMQAWADYLDSLRGVNSQPD